jgi:arylsulfatase
LPLIENPQAKWDDRYLYTHVARWPTGSEPNKYQWQKFAVRNQRYRLVGTQQLYDMQKDPNQTTNVIADHADVVKEMKAAYDAWWQETRPLMVNEDAEMSPTRPYHVWFNKQQKESGIPKWEAPQL